MPFYAIIKSMKNNVNILIFILWCVLALVGLFHHELWRDETQVWCLVRDMNFVDLFAATRIEGHPMLWYLLVFPFAKLGLPVESMQVLSFALVGCAVAIMLWKSPFSNLEKFLVSLSAGMVYFLPVIARNYALIPLALFLIAYFYPRRSEVPYKYAFSLILLSQTHSLVFAFSGLLFIFFTIEKLKEKRHFIPLILLFINFFVLFCIFCIAGTENHVIRFYNQNAPALGVFLQKFCSIYFEPIFKNFKILNIIIFYGSLSIFACELFKQDKKIFSLFVVNLLYIYSVFLKVWFGGILYQKAFILLLFIVFCYWVAGKGSKALKVVFIILFSISSLLSIPNVLDEIRYQFSGSKQIATYIKENLQDKEYKFLGYPYTISPISAYLPDRRFHSNEQMGYVTYYDFRYRRTANDIEKSNAKYFIVQRNISIISNDNFKEIFATDNKILGPRKEAEVYKIYEKI